jgi:hypothetical protein
MPTIPLTRGLETAVDDEDFLRFGNLNWYAADCNGYFYAARTVRRRVVYLHRVIAGAPGNLHVDHKDGNTLNNRRDNLRCCKRPRNQWNWRKRKGASLYRGVSFCKQTGRWQASIMANGRRRRLGRFSTEQEASAAYERAAVRREETGRV